MYLQNIIHTMYRSILCTVIYVNLCKLNIYMCIKIKKHIISGKWDPRGNGTVTYFFIFKTYLLHNI